MDKRASCSVPLTRILLVVSARTDGGQRSAEGAFPCFAWRPMRRGLTVRAYGTQDDHRAADLDLGECGG